MISKLKKMPIVSLIGAMTIAFSLQVSTIPAHADDDDLYCWEWDDGTLECDTIGNLKAECELTDPDNTTEVCSDVNANLSRGRPTLLTTEQPDDRGSNSVGVGTSKAPPQTRR